VSVLIDMAAAVLAVLEGASLSLPFTAARGYVIVRDISAQDGIRVSVIPGGEEITAFDLKPRHEYDPEVMVWVQATARPTPAECDPLMQLTEEIIGLFLPGKRLPGTAANITKVAYEPTFDPAMLDEQRTFTAGITITFMFTR
jgi:hypothetical protein